MAGARAADAILERLREVLAQRERARAPLRTVRVVGRNADGTTALLRDDAVCVTRGDTEGLYVGETTTAAARTPYSRQGTSGLSAESESYPETTVWVDRLEPDVFAPNSGATCTVHGRGFGPGMAFEFLLPAGEGRRPKQVNGGCLVNSATYVSETEYQLDLAVGFPLLERAALAWDVRRTGPSAGDLTDLRKIKLDAYSVRLQLVDRERYLETSPLAACWDANGGRVLFDRQRLLWQEVEGIDGVWEPPDGRPPYTIELEIVAVPRERLGDVSAVDQGVRVALLDRLTSATEPSIAQRQVTGMACEPESGAIAVYSRLTPQDGSPSAPYRRDLHGFSRTGGSLGVVSELEGQAGDYSWDVGAAEWYGGLLYAIEANVAAAGSRSASRLVRRDGIGSVSASWDLPSPATNPVALCAGDGAIYVLVVEAIPSGPGTVNGWWLYRLSSTFEVLDQWLIDFGHDVDEPFPYSFAWPGSSSPYPGGGNLIYGGGGSLISAGYSPDGFPGEEPNPPPTSTFRWSPADGGTPLGDLGEAVSNPLHPVGSTGVLGRVAPETADPHALPKIVDF